jgi:hypothetical protein
MRQPLFVWLLGLGMLAACGSSRPASRRPAQPVIEPRAVVRDRCQALSAGELAQAKRMTWTNEGEMGPGYGYAMFRIALRRDGARFVLEKTPRP